jgi:hypothetical protein
MANKHPYVSSPGGLVQVITHLRTKSLPATVNAATLRKLGFAPNNESYVLNVLRFLGLIDDEGRSSAEAKKVLTLHEDVAFAKAFAALVKSAYSDLFDINGDSAWDLDSDALITFFRSNDGTTAIVGKHQASTFHLLAAFSGHGDVPEPRVAKTNPVKKPAATTKKAPAKSKPAASKAESSTVVTSSEASVGLSVRIEVNLPADGDQATYDRIFKSIRENLLNG